MFSPKNAGSIKYCVDYCHLSAVTGRDLFPLQRIDECINAFKEPGTSKHYMHILDIGRFKLRDKTYQERSSRFLTDTFKFCKCHSG